MTIRDPRIRAQLSGLRLLIQNELLPWFARNKRDLPWRKRRSAYRVWISELMLHQTRVDQAIPYYHRFLRRFPSLKALAEAPLADVLKQWEGLGYYARARNAHKTAHYLYQTCGGRFPRSYEGLRTLPGVGPYTAAAVASLAFNQDQAVLDGNVIRVLSRLTAFPDDVRLGRSKQQLQALSDTLLVKGQAAAFNEALMELGAVCCTPRAPQCPVCPLRKGCRARREQAVERYPVSKPKAKIPHKEVGAGVVVNRRGQVLIAQRLASSMLGGLWEFPGGTQEPGESMEQCIARELKEELGIEVRVGAHLMTVRHAYSHFTIALHVHWCRIRKGRPRPLQCADVKWIAPAALRQLAFSRADQHIIDRIQTDSIAQRHAALEAPTLQTLP